MEVNRPTVIRDGPKRGNDAWDQVIADNVVEVMQDRGRRLQIWPNNDLKRYSNHQRIDDPIPALLEGSDLVSHFLPERGRTTCRDRQLANLKPERRFPDQAGPGVLVDAGRNAFW